MKCCCSFHCCFWVFKADETEVLERTRVFSHHCAARDSSIGLEKLTQVSRAEIRFGKVLHKEIVVSVAEAGLIPLTPCLIHLDSESFLALRFFLFQLAKLIRKTNKVTYIFDGFLGVRGPLEEHKSITPARKILRKRDPCRDDPAIL